MDCGIKSSKNDSGCSVDPTLFKSLVGSLRILTYSKPNILYRGGLISRYMEDQKSSRFKTAKRIVCYIKGTCSHGLFYSSNKFQLAGYSDSDWRGNLDDRKNTIRFVFFMGDTAFTWSSKKQPIATLSTCELSTLLHHLLFVMHYD